MEAVRYEGYGIHGVAVMVDCLTDNKNRTVADVRHAFSKSGGQLAAEGAVAYLFSHRGEITFPPGTNEESVMEVALEQGALDVIENEDQSIDVITIPENFEKVKAALAEKGFSSEMASITQIPSTYVTIDKKDSEEKLLRLFERLEDLDDVQTVYSNADFKVSDS